MRVGTITLFYLGEDGPTYYVSCLISFSQQGRQLVKISAFGKLLPHTTLPI